MTEFAANTHTGLKRTGNEDCFHADPERGLFLVADGVGGHARGEVASDIARKTVQQQINSGATLRDAILESHEAILSEITHDDGRAGMGSTVVAVKLERDTFELGWVGDSRAYLWDGDLTQLSQDHNQVSEMVQRGEISPEDASRHPDRNILTQSLGVSRNMHIKPGKLSGMLKSGQQLLLCSDGLTDEVPDQQIAQIMAVCNNPQDQVDALLSAALAAGGRDNITVVIVGSCGDPQPQPDMDTTQELDPTATRLNFRL